MIRWYDWLAAVIAADFLLAGILYSLTAPEWYMSLIGAFSAFVVWDIWNGYCLFRKNKESE